MLRKADGRAISREEVQHVLKLAAIANGQDPEQMGSHSLRIGGATAMYLFSKDLEEIKRFGRWTSDAFHGYLHEDHGRTKGVAKQMATMRSELMRGKA